MVRKEYDVRINYSMPLAVLVVILVAMVLAFVGFAISSSSPNGMSLIRITSSGTVTASPDEAAMYLYVNGTGATAASAAANQSSIAGALNQTLISLLNGNASKLQTLSYNLYVPSQCPNATPYYYYRPYYCIPPGGQPFYVAAESLLVNLPNSGNVSDAITRIASFGGVGIGSVSAMLSTQQQTVLGQQALTLALANATNQAQALAGSGVEVTVLNITVNSGYVYYPVYSSGSVSSSSTPKNQSFFPGTIDVTRSISVVFGIKR